MSFGFDLLLMAFEYWVILLYISLIPIIDSHFTIYWQCKSLWITSAWRITSWASVKIKWNCYITFSRAWLTINVRKGHIGQLVNVIVTSWSTVAVIESGNYKKIHFTLLKAGYWSKRRYVSILWSEVGSTNRSFCPE